MEKEEKIQKLPNPRKNATFLSIVTFAYTLPTFLKGFRKDLQEEDIPWILNHHSSKRLGDALEKSWEREMKKERPSLFRALARIFWVEFVLLGLMLFILEVVLKIFQSLSLARLITYYTHTSNVNETNPYKHAGIIIACSYLNVLMGHNYMQILHVFGMKLRIACCSLIYRKSLRLKKHVLGGFRVGLMVNLLSNDVNRCDRAVNHAHNLWVCPLETIIIMYILHSLLGFVSIIGILFMILFVPLQCMYVMYMLLQLKLCLIVYLGQKNYTYRFKTAFKTDERVGLMNEVITGIQVIKMYTWEQSFMKLVKIIRELEIRYVRYAAYIKGILSSCAGFTSRCAIAITIITYVLLGNTPQAEYVFIVTSFYNILRQAITVHFSGGITELSELKVSITRLQKFLTYEEVDQTVLDQRSVGINCKIEKDSKDALYSSIDNSLTNIDINIKVYLKHAFAKWSPDCQGNTLNDITITLHEKDLTAIIGPVGSGKTSLLQTILNELPLISGILRTEGIVSYASQDPWLFGGTIQQNILFGASMNLERYRNVIKVCALERDLINFPQGDKTIVGSRGATLSGGQKARINLARAIYKKADIYLLDDPLSAVDTSVGKHLFSECILQFLKQKCVILVTHQLQYLQNVKSIYLMESGSIAMSGSYNDLKNSDFAFTKLLTTNAVFDETEIVEKKSLFDSEFILSTESISTEKEGIGTGKISSGVYKTYIESGGSLWRLWFVILIFIITYTVSHGSDYFLTYWINMEQAKSLNYSSTLPKIRMLKISRSAWIIIYSTLVCVMIFLSLLGTLRFYNLSMLVSKNLHNTMFNSLINAPMRFFNVNSPGRILNRFSKDTGLIDDVLPTVTLDCITIGISIIAVMTMVCFLNPWMLLATTFVLGVFYLLRTFYLATSRRVKHLEGATRSPVFAHMSASLQGITTIRAFGAEKILEKEFDNHQDLHSSVWYTFLVSSRAFGFWLDLVCVSYVAIVTFGYLVIGRVWGNVGLAITQAMALTGTFQWGMRQWSEFENLMTSVERMVEYIRIQPETQTWKTIPPPKWPYKGNIEFRSVSLKYAETDPSVLKQLSFNIACNEKIGIVGRTGSGKTSLINALFRLSEISGTIIIDQVDITTIPLYKLRSQISIIPQEPVLFSGLLRANLDPFNEHTDEELWNALEQIELKRLIAELPLGLRYIMPEGGTNFSVGQRQLLCLARAIIRKNRILILDEATANLDPNTDILIQNTIRNKFSNCTVLTIAHRLNTIIDSDRVMVIDNGQLVEFDHPYILLLSKSSLFYSMADRAGHTMLELLLNVAKTNYKSKFPNQPSILY